MPAQRAFRRSWLSLMLEHLGLRLSGVALPSSPDLFTLALLGPWSRLDHRTFEIRDDDSILATSGKFIADARCRGGRMRVGRAIEWTQMINPLPQQPSHAERNAGKASSRLAVTAQCTADNCRDCGMVQLRVEQCGPFRFLQSMRSLQPEYSPNGSAN
jgi:hypothetical protein